MLLAQVTGHSRSISSCEHAGIYRDVELILCINIITQRARLTDSRHRLLLLLADNRCNDNGDEDGKLQSAATGGGHAGVRWPRVLAIAAGNAMTTVFLQATGTILPDGPLLRLDSPATTQLAGIRAAYQKINRISERSVAGAAPLCRIAIECRTTEAPPRLAARCSASHFIALKE